MSKRGGYPRGGGAGNNMNNLMKQAQRMQRDMLAAQEELNTMEFESSSGGGMVSAVVLGNNTLKSISIDPEALDPDDVEMLQDMIVAAVNEALRSAAESSEQRMNSFTGGLNIPGLM